MLGRMGRWAALALAAAVLAAPAQASAYTQERHIVAAGHGEISPSHLVVHETANPGAGAWNHVLYWGRNAGTAAMTQFVMDTDGSVVYQVMEANRLAWHVGYGNRRSYGIELCHAVTRGDFERQWAEAAQWCADQLRSRGWGLDRLVSHDEARRLWGGTDHTDPVGYFAKYGRTWAQFEAEVAARMRSGEAGSASASEGNGAGSGFAGGTYRCTVAALNVRSGPGLGYPVVAGYGRGQTVALDSWYAVRDGYVWSRYASWSGRVRYVAVGRPTGRPEAGDFLVRVGGSAPPAPATKGTEQVAREVVRGEWGNGAARRERLRAAGYDYAAVQGLVNRMLS